MEDEYSVEGAVVGSEVHVSAAASYRKEANSPSLTLADEEYVAKRLERLAEAAGGDDYDTADAIAMELLLSYDVRINNEHGTWSIGQSDAGIATEAGTGQGSGSASDSTWNELEELTVPLLKERLRERGLKVGGRKSELIERLLAGPS